MSTKVIIWKISAGAFILLAGLSCTTLYRNAELSTNLQSDGSSQNRAPASLNEQMLKLNPKKPTVCSVTLNSTEEREVFRKYLTMFNHIELADVDIQSLDNSIKGGRWMERVCNKGIKCDILVMSGHFAGTFFGTSELRLPAETLEKMSCDPGCDGIMKNPREIFLFGCNTLAGKTADSRTPEEYMRVLREDGFSVLEAQQIAALRYSPVGSSFHDRMSRTFADSPKIYGFNSKGPLGKNVKHLLENYFSKIPNYSSHLSKIRKEKVNSVWASALAVTSQAQTSGRSAKINYCPLYDTQLSYVDKLRLIKTLMNDHANFIEQVPLISKFVEMEAKNRTRMRTQDENALTESIRSNEKTREMLHKFLSGKPSGMLRVQISMLNIARFFEFWPESYSEQIQKNLIGDLRKHSDQERLEIISLQGISLPGLRLEDLPQDLWNLWDIHIISLLKPTDVRIIKRLSEYLERPGELSEAAMQSIVQLGYYDSDIIKKFIQYGSTFSMDLKLLRSSEIFAQVLQYLNGAPRNDDILTFYNGLISKLMKESTFNLSGNLFSPLEYFSKNQISNDKAFDFALRAWESGVGGRAGWYSYRYLTVNRPCTQLPRLRQAEDNLRKNRLSWVAFDDNSFDESMGVTTKMTENFKEVEIYPRIYELCK